MRRRRSLMREVNRAAPSLARRRADGKSRRCGLSPRKQARRRPQKPQSLAFDPRNTGGSEPDLPLAKPRRSGALNWSGEPEAAPCHTERAIDHGSPARQRPARQVARCDARFERTIPDDPAGVAGPAGRPCEAGTGRSGGLVVAGGQRLGGRQAETADASVRGTAARGGMVSDDRADQGHQRTTGSLIRRGSREGASWSSPPLSSLRHVSRT